MSKGRHSAKYLKDLIADILIKINAKITIERCLVIRYKHLPEPVITPIPEKEDN